MTFRDEIRDTVSPYKFGGNRMAAACWLLSLESAEDEATGDATEWGYYVARFGKRLLVVDSQGFVDCTRYISEEAAQERFAGWEADYAAYYEQDDVPSGFVPSESVTINSFMPGDTVRVDGHGGIAWRVEGLPVWHGSDYEWSGCFYQNPDERIVHMVGDDRSFTFGVDELSPLDEDDYCHECGQIGCTADGR